MTWLQAVVLGVVQGLTELLPVSSSGHLALVPALLGWDPPALEFTVAVHLGTLVAICVYFRSDLHDILEGVWCVLTKRAQSEEAAKETRAQVVLAWLLLLGSVPAVAGGLLFEHAVAASFGSVRSVGIFLVVTACLLWGGQYLSRRKSGRRVVDWKDAVVVGLGQAFALLPGISRSGATISAGLVRGLAPVEAVRFAFLLGIPVMLGGGALEGVRAIQAKLPPAELGLCLLGATVAGVSAWAGIAVVFKAVRRGRLNWFGVYCAAVGLTILAISLAGYVPA